MLFGLSTQCFTGDILVTTEDGLKPIEDVKVGEFVWSEDTETGEKELRKVLAVFVTETMELVHVWVGKEEIKTTQNHPFYVEGQGWKAAGELVAGDVLRTESGCRESVRGVSIERLEEPVRVWNLEIERQHTYFVGENKILVHNNCPNPDGKKGGKAHQDKINEISSGRGEIRYEEMYKTNNGYKTRRFADAVEVVDGEITRIYQIGKVNKNGMPIAREIKANEDIMKSDKYNGVPIFFIPYNIDMGEIIYDY